MKRSLGWILALATLAGRATAQITVPIYFEDNHAGSFYWLAQHLDLEQPCTLLHFDAHSDASALFDSDKIRDRLRRVSSSSQRLELLRKWRNDGTIQCFNWIEPLMPAPIAQVIWVSRGESERVETARQLDGNLEASPRAAGSLQPRYRTLHLRELEASGPIEGSVIATIDLDYFSALSPNEQSTEFERVWKIVVGIRDLRAVTFAISRPYLADDQEADRLVRLALAAALSLPTARIQFEPYRTVVGHDGSLRAREYRAQGKPVPSFDLRQSSEATRALLLANRERIVVRADAPRWEEALAEWRAAAPDFHLAIKRHQPPTDNIWRVSVADPAQIEVLADPWDTNFGRVQWIAEVPEFLRCNLINASEDKISFARGAPPRPRWREVVLSSTDKSLPISELARFFDPRTGAGALRIKARIEADHWARETPVMELRRSRGTGFRAALSEQFGLPYLFGSGELRAARDTGPETGWGADCANFVVYALRRQGRAIPWSNPRQLRQYLEPVAQRIELSDSPAFAAADLERGVILHLGTHVAALMEDRPPLGVLNADDIVAHQLEGVPALISVGELLRARGITLFDLLRVPAEAATNDLLIGGDVMLGRTVGDQIVAGADPFAGVRAVLQRAGNVAVNLECVASDKGTPAPNKQFRLRAPPAAIGALGAAGIKLVGVANNHADDFGIEAARDASEGLRVAGLTTIADGEFARIQCGHSRVALLALDDTRNPPLAPNEIAQSITQARTEADCVIALVHWGEENTAEVTERQRALARWLIDHGVDLIAGSHSHCLQPVDSYHGRPIVYSLGNLVFDGAPTVPEWNRGALLELSFGDAPTRSPTLRLLPVKLDRRGFPELVEPARAQAD